MIDFDAISAKLVAIAREPNYTAALSTTDGFKSVFITRPDDIAPDYPYISLDILDVREENGYLLEHGSDENDNPYWETIYVVLFSYRVYGAGALSIANQLQGYFRRESVIDDISSSTGAAVRDMNPIDNLPFLMEDRFIESAAFTFEVGVIDRDVDTSDTGIIDTVDLDGELYRGVGDVDPLLVPITVTTPP